MSKPLSVKALAILFTAFTLLGVGCQKQIDYAPPKQKNEAPVVQPAVVNTYDTSTISPSNYTELTKFSDQTLGITFEYPKYWGKIKTLLTCAPEGRLTKGCKYDMIFESSDKDMIIQSPVFNDGQFRIEAGGRSTDYQLGNEGTLLDDTRLASNKSSDEICKLFHASKCSSISSQVTSMTVIPRFDDICPPNPAQYGLSKIVVVQLRSKSKVQSVAFAYNFHSSSKSDELYATLGSNFSSCHKPTSEAKAAFSSKAASIIDNVTNQTLDAESQRRSDEFDRFVKSITISK